MLLRGNRDKLFRIITYCVKYILFVILFSVGSAFLGVPCLYSIPLAVPFLTYLVLVWSIIRPLEQDTKIKKEDLLLPMFVVTTIFNVLFFYVIRRMDLLITIFIIVTNMVEFLILKPRYKR